jgi:hypothetical protein
MQELRFVAVSEDGSYAVLAVPGRSARFTLPIDERLRAVALGQTSRLAQYEIEVESPLRPKEIQARIRAGETVEEIADAAGIPVERVRWFEGPVLAERAYLAEQAQSASVRRQGDSAPGPRLGEIVAGRLKGAGVDPEDARWDSRKRGDGSWQVQVAFSFGGRLETAEWAFDPRRRHASPDDDNAERLSLPDGEFPPPVVSVPGEATVTPLAPRLGAVSAGGGGSARIRSERPPLAPPPPVPVPQTPPSQQAGPPRPAPVRVPAAMTEQEPEPSPEPAIAKAEAVAGAEPAARAADREAERVTEPVPGDAQAGAALAGGEPARVPAADQSAAAAEATPEPAPSQPGRQRKSARGRRSSVPSWDEIMLGSSRNRD